MQLKQIEEFLQERVFPELENGRPDFDKPHTQSVVRNLKGIIRHSPSINIDPVVLIIAAYTHDWGYTGLFIKGNQLSLNDINDAKKMHMEIGKEKVTSLLNDKFFSFLTSVQKMRIAHLVAMHDRLDELKDLDELILMEADTLGGLDIRSENPLTAFDKESNQRYLLGTRKRRLVKFITVYAKKEYEKLYKQREEFYRLKYGS